MYPERVNVFIEMNKDNFFPNDKYDYSTVVNKLMAAPDSMELYLRNMKMRSPSTVFILSVLLGSIGVDRFYLGDIVGGVFKYFTFGGLGIWWIIDIISAKKRCCTKNCEILMKTLDSVQYTSAPNMPNMTGAPYIPNAPYTTGTPYVPNYQNIPNVPSAPNGCTVNNNTHDLSGVADKAKAYAPVAKEIVKGAKSIGKTFHMN